VSSSSFGSPGAADSSQGTPTQPVSPAGRTYERSLLESVLQQTLEDSEAGVPLEDADSQALSEVVRRHRGQPLTLEPIAVELVQAVLWTHYGRLASSPEFWRTVSAEVAQTLFDDPVASPRLERLWHRLGRIGS
jgi:hypothetical protein